MAVNAEFPKRPDGLPGLEKAYGFKISRADLKAMDSGLTYQALKDGKVDIALVFATDGRIKAFDFRVLKDDKEFFPNYAIAPVVRTETLKANPGLAPPLNALSAKLTDAVMQKLNAEVDVDKKSVEDVAADFLSNDQPGRLTADAACRRRVSARAGDRPFPDINACQQAFTIFRDSAMTLAAFQSSLPAHA